MQCTDMRCCCPAVCSDAGCSRSDAATLTMRNRVSPQRDNKGQRGSEPSDPLSHALLCMSPLWCACVRISACAPDAVWSRPLRSSHAMTPAAHAAPQRSVTKWRTCHMQLQQPLRLPRLLRPRRSSITARTRTATSARSSVWPSASCTRKAATKHISQHAFPATCARCAIGWRRKTRTTVLAAAASERRLQSRMQRSLLRRRRQSSPHLAASVASSAWMSPLAPSIADSSR